MTLYHFSEDPGIERFVPRPVRAPARRQPGREWLNGPLVWAIDERHQPMYFFPRDCPRILLWAKDDTTEADRERWLRGSPARMLALVEESRMAELVPAKVYRYDLPGETFEALDDAGMWVSRDAVTPSAVECIGDLPRALAAADVELRAIPSFALLRDVWQSTVHASGIRLRNAAGWV